MQYKFSQFRRKQHTNYLTLVSSGNNIQDLETKLILDSNTRESTLVMDSLNFTFKDKKLVLNKTTNNTASVDVLEPVDENYGTMKSYYLKFKVPRMPTEQRILIKLSNGSATKDTSEQVNDQYIQEIVVPAGENTMDEFKIIFRPKAEYSEIHFQLRRTRLDIVDAEINKNNDAYHAGREIRIIDCNLYEITNIVNVITTKFDSHVRSLIQVGVQGPLGMLMSIEGEGVRIGRTGQYEINFGASITFIGFVIEPDDEQTNFIMDYQYRYVETKTGTSKNDSIS